jgi:hypothetical protein
MLPWHASSICSRVSHITYLHPKMIPGISMNAHSGHSRRCKGIVIPCVTLIPPTRRTGVLPTPLLDSFHFRPIQFPWPFIGTTQVLLSLAFPSKSTPQHHGDDTQHWSNKLGYRLRRSGTPTRSSFHQEHKTNPERLVPLNPSFCGHCQWSPCAQRKRHQ